MPVPLATVALWASRGYAAYQIAEGIRQRFCTLQQQFPEFTARAIGNLPGGDSLINPLVPAICPSAPPASSQNNVFPYLGGQCCAVYTMRWTRIGNGSTTQLQETVAGKIGAIRDTLFDVPNANQQMGLQWQGFIEIQTDLDCPGRTPRWRTLTGGQNWQGARPTYTNLTFTRVDGLPDNCGDRPITGTPLIPSPNDLNFTVTIPIGGRSFSVPVQFNLNLNPTLNFNFQPTISFSTPIGEFVFSPDGLDIFFPGSGDSPGTPPFGLPDPRNPSDRPPPQLPPYLAPRIQPPGGGGGDCPDVNLKPILDAIEAIAVPIEETLDGVEELLERDCCTSHTPEQCRRILIGTGQSGQFQLGDDVLWVGVIIDEKPSNFKGFANENSPDVVYAGWFEFGGGNSSGVRSQLQYDRNIYPKLSKATSFSFGLQAGYIGSCYAYVRPDDPETNN